jgi:DNA-directed RNA polymerase alpha subunit
MMEIKDVSSKGNVATFLVSKTTPAFVNALRRSAISLVPSLAIETVEIVKNNSALYDEVLAHRLGLIPLVTDLGSYKLTQISDSVFRPESQVRMTLVAKGPCIVLASQLVSTDKSVKSAEPEMPIVKLLEGQEIELNIIAQMGQGIKHMKWSPCAAYYQNASTAKGATPAKLAETKSAEIIAEKNATRKEDEFVFTIESWGGISPKEILLEAVRQLDGQLTELTEAAK